MKATEADKYKTAPKLADLDAGAAGMDMHEHSGADMATHDHGDGHAHAMESVRTATHCGHEIVIKTCYEISIDGKPLASHLSVGDDGAVHTHALPEYAFTSAVDLVKQIIEAFPDEFPCDDHEPGHDHGGADSSSDQQGHGHDEHTHEHP
ncbi:MAG: hypothetical protein QOJ94_163 [Sphingomonadales bacterium]|jgi:hypothetical protein|nr:hypothetical protein [Sphingomonadales bacterium]